MQKNKILIYVVVVSLLALNVVALLNVTSLRNLTDVIQTKEVVQGDTGPKGDTGLKGDTGSKGDLGDQGLSGEDGLDGLDGLDGQDGLDGEKGPVGPTGKVESTSSLLPYVSLGLALNETYQSLNLFEDASNQIEYVQSKLDSGYVGISNQEELEAINKDRINISLAKYVLTADIFLNAETFSSIEFFSGILDGANYSIYYDYNPQQNEALLDINQLSLFKYPFKADFFNLDVVINVLSQSNTLSNTGFISNPLGYIRLVGVNVELNIVFNPKENVVLGLPSNIGAIFSRIDDFKGPFYLERTEGKLMLEFKDGVDSNVHSIEKVGGLTGFIGGKNLLLVFDSAFIVDLRGTLQNVVDLGGVIGVSEAASIFFRGVLSETYLNVEIKGPYFAYDLNASRIAGSIGNLGDNSVFIVEQSAIFSNMLLKYGGEVVGDQNFTISEVGGVIGSVKKHPQILINNSAVDFRFTAVFLENDEPVFSNIGVHQIGGVIGNLGDSFSSAVLRRSIVTFEIELENRSLNTNTNLIFNVSGVGGVLGDFNDKENVNVYVIDAIVSFAYYEEEFRTNSTTFNSYYIGALLGNGFRGTNILDNVYVESRIGRVLSENNSDGGYVFVDSSGWDYYKNITTLQNFNYNELELETFMFKDVWNFEDDWMFVLIEDEINFLLPKALLRQIMLTFR